MLHCRAWFQWVGAPSPEDRLDLPRPLGRFRGGARQLAVLEPAQGPPGQSVAPAPTPGPPGQSPGPTPGYSAAREPAPCPAPVPHGRARAGDVIARPSRRAGPAARAPVGALRGAALQAAAPAPKWWMSSMRDTCEMRSGLSAVDRWVKKRHRTPSLPCGDRCVGGRARCRRDPIGGDALAGRHHPPVPGKG